MSDPILTAQETSFLQSLNLNPNSNNLKEEIKILIEQNKNQILDLAKQLWDYNRIDNTVTLADLIWVLGSHDTSVATYASNLFLQGFGKQILFSGGFPVFNRTRFYSTTEAQDFAKIAIEMGVQPEFILMEENSSNTGENILFGMELLKAKNINPQSIILVQKPYSERRAMATFQNYWPDKNTKLIIGSNPITFEEYLTRYEDIADFVNILVGQLERVKIYPQKGYQLKQEIPESILQTYYQLIRLGFDENLLEKENPASFINLPVSSNLSQILTKIYTEIIPNLQKNGQTWDIDYNFERSENKRYESLKKRGCSEVIKVT